MVQIELSRIGAAVFLTMMWTGFLHYDVVGKGEKLSTFDVRGLEMLIVELDLKVEGLRTYWRAKASWRRCRMTKQICPFVGFAARLSVHYFLPPFHQDDFESHSDSHWATS